MSHRKLIITTVILLAGLFVSMTGSGNDGAWSDEAKGKSRKSKNEDMRLQVQSGHTGDVDILKWNPDGIIFASGSSDNTIRLWDTNGKILKALTGHTAPISGLYWSPDGELLLSTAYNASDIDQHSRLGIVQDKTIRIWNRSGKLIKIIDGHDGYHQDSITWSPDSKFFAAEINKEVHIFTREGLLYKILNIPKDYCDSIKWSMDGIIASCSSGLIYLYSFKNGTIDKVLPISDTYNSKISWSPDGSILVFYDTNSIWFFNDKGDLLKKQIINKSADSFFGYVELLWSPDGNVLVSQRGDDIFLWKKDGTPITKINSSWCKNLVWSPDGKYLALGCHHYGEIWKNDGTLIQKIEYAYFMDWNPHGNLILSRSGNEISIFREDGLLLKKTEPNNNSIASFAKSPMEDFFVLGDWNRNIQIWKNGNLYNKQKITVEDISFATSSDWIVGNICWRPDGKVFVSSIKNKVNFWKSSGEFIKEIKVHKFENIISIAWDPNGEILSCATWDNSITLLNSHGDLLKIIYGHKNAIRNLSWSPDGTILASGSGETALSRGLENSMCNTFVPDFTVRLWSRDGQHIKTLEGHTDIIETMDWNPDGMMIASGSMDKTILLWGKEGRLIKKIEGHDKGVYIIKWSPDGNILASGSADNTVRLWNKDGQLIKILEGHKQPINLLKWSSDGRYIASGSWDNSIRIWKRDGKIEAVLDGHNDTIKELEYIRDEKFLFSASHDSTIKIWDMRSGKNVITTQLYGNGNYITYTPDYYYRLSGDAVNAVAFVNDTKMKAYGFDQFDLRHNRPDIVLERLYPDTKTRPKNIQEQITRYKKYWEFRVAKNGFKPEQVSGETTIHSPEVYDIKLNGTPIDKADTTVKEQEVTLSFKIKDEDGSDFKVIGYKIFVNGVPVHGQYIKRFNKAAKVQEVTEKITLSGVPDVGTGPGDNRIEISGFTEDGVESGRETVFLKYECKETRGNLYIVCLGVNDYSKSTGFGSLNYAVGDVADIVDTFTAAGKGRYNKIIPVIYTGNKVTRDVVKEIKDKLGKTGVNDTVVFFISGHGMRADTDLSTAADVAKYFGIDYNIGDITDNKNKVNVYYYMTGDSNSNEPWIKGIPMDAIRYCMDAIPARQKLLLIDTCQSGENNELSGCTPSEERLEEVRKRRSALAANKLEKGIKLHRGRDYDEKGIIVETAYNLDMKEMSEMFPELRRGTGTIEISASTGSQSALESSEWKNGAFTFVIKEAILKGRAKDSSGKITAKSLRSYVLDRVEQLTGGDQTPMVCRDIAGRDFVIGECN